MSLQLAQDQLQNALLTTYLANLLFLSKYDNDLYQRIEKLSQEIESNNYIERYTLEFLEDSGDFDIYDKVNKKYIYNKEPKKFNNKAINTVNFDTKGQFVHLEPFFYTKRDKYKCDEFEINNAENSLKLVSNHIQNFIDILDDELTTVKTRKIKKIKKFIFLGTLLARHIPGIVKKIKAEHFLVCEPNLEVFRLSLFVFDYTLLVENDRSVVFSIMEEDYIFAAKYRTFAQNASYYNNAVKYFSTNYNIEKYFDLILDGIMSNKPTSYDYQRILKSIVKHSFERINNRNVICSKKDYPNSLFKSKPVLFIGAGPSFMDNMEWIKNNQNYFIIVAMGATYNNLMDNKIRVDIITSVDSSYEIIEKLQFHNEGLNKITDQIMLLSINTHDKIEEKFNQDNIFEFLVMNSLHQESELQSGYSIGEIVIILLLQLKVKDLYLIGLDFSINQVTGESHANKSNSSTKSFDLNNIKSSLDTNTFDLHDDLFKVKGNTLDKVFTNRLYNMSLSTLSKSLDAKEFNNINIYNLSENGAYIENTIPLNKKDFSNKYNKLDLKNINSKLKKEFLAKSKNHLSISDTKKLIKEKKYLLLIIETLESKLKLEVNNYENFFLLYEKDIFEKLVHPTIDCSLVAPVFNSYFNMILPYIDYCFNDKKIKNEKQKIKLVREELNKQLNYLLKIYISYLEKAIK